MTIFGVDWDTFQSIKLSLLTSEQTEGYLSVDGVVLDFNFKKEQYRIVLTMEQLNQLEKAIKHIRTQYAECT